MKKLIALLLACLMLVGMAACAPAESEGEGTTAGGSGETTGGAEQKPEKLVVWTLAEDLKNFAEHYTEATGIEVEVNVIAPADYPTKLFTALGAQSDEVDIIVGEPQMLPDFFEAGFFADLSELDAEASEKLVSYIYEAGKDVDGTLRALSYQVTPGSIIYRRDLAQEVFGTDDPEEIGKLFSSYDAILNAAAKLDAAGYDLFGDTGALRWFANANTPWVKDGVLQMTDAQMGYFDTAVELYEKEYVAFAPEWSPAWYASMAGELPVNAGWSALEEIGEDAPTTQIFSYIMPSWGAVIIRDNANDNKGNFGVCKGITSFFGGGTFLGVNEFSKNKAAAVDFIKFCTLNEETSQWWIEKSNGDIVSMKSVLEANKDYENPSFGNQKTYAFFMEEAQNIDYSLVTRYDTEIGNAFGQAIVSVQTGEKDKETALRDFYTAVQAVYPEIQVPES